MDLLLRLELHKLMDKVSRPSKYQILVYIALGFNVMPVAFHHLFMLLAASETGYWCVAPDGSLPAYELPAALNSTGPSAECYHYDEDTLKATGECSRWKYYLGKKNVITEWNLVCSEEWLVRLSSTVYFIGAAAGGLIGFLADDFGRKLLLLICTLTHIVFGVALYFADTFVLFDVFRTLQGLLMQGLFVCGVVLVLETLPTRMRIGGMLIFGVFWVAGFLWMVLMDYLIQDWRFVELALSLPSVLAILGIWVLPESVPWLAVRKRLVPAENQLKKIAAFNKVVIDDQPLSSLVTPENPNDPATASVEDIRLGTKLRTPRLRRNKFVMVVLWFVVWFNYFGMTFNPQPITENKYYDLIIDVAVDLPLLLVMPFVVFMFGTRNTTGTSFVLGGVFSVTGALVPEYSYYGEPTGWIRFPFVLISKMIAASDIYLLFLFAAEIMPTRRRATTIGSFSCVGALGAAVAIQVHWAVAMASAGYFRLIYLVYGGLFLIAALLCQCLLPMTNKDSELPDTSEDAEFVGAKPQEIRDAKRKGGAINIEEGASYVTDEEILSNDNFSFGRRPLGSETSSVYIGFGELGQTAEVASSKQLIPTTVDSGGVSFRNPFFISDSEDANHVVVTAANDNGPVRTDDTVFSDRINRNLTTQTGAKNADDKEVDENVTSDSGGIQPGRGNDGLDSGVGTIDRETSKTDGDNRPIRIDDIVLNDGINRHLTAQTGARNADYKEMDKNVTSDSDGIEPGRGNDGSDSGVGTTNRQTSNTDDGT